MKVDFCKSANVSVIRPTTYITVPIFNVTGFPGRDEVVPSVWGREHTAPQMREMIQNTAIIAERHESSMRVSMFYMRRQVY